MLTVLPAINHLERSKQRHHRLLYCKVHKNLTDVAIGWNTTIKMWLRHGSRFLFHKRTDFHQGHQSCHLNTNIHTYTHIITLFYIEHNHKTRNRSRPFRDVHNLSNSKVERILMKLLEGCVQTRRTIPKRARPMLLTARNGRKDGGKMLDRRGSDFTLDCKNNRKK